MKYCALVFALSVFERVIEKDSINLFSKRVQKSSKSYSKVIAFFYSSFHSLFSILVAHLKRY